MDTLKIQSLYKNLKTRGDVEKKQFSIKMKIAKLKKKSFCTRGEENKFRERNILPLQLQLIKLSEIWGYLPY